MLRWKELTWQPLFCAHPAPRITSHSKERPHYWVQDPLKSVVLEVQVRGKAKVGSEWLLQRPPLYGGRRGRRAALIAGGTGPSACCRKSFDLTSSRAR